MEVKGKEKKGKKKQSACRDDGGVQFTTTTNPQMSPKFVGSVASAVELVDKRVASGSTTNSIGTKEGVDSKLDTNTYTKTQTQKATTHCRQHDEGCEMDNHYTITIYYYYWMETEKEDREEKRGVRV